MKLFKNIFKKEEDVQVEQKSEVNSAPKEKKRTMPEVNKKELYRIEKQKRREAAQKRREEEAKKQEEMRQARLKEIHEREEIEREKRAKKHEELVEARKNQTVETKKVAKVETKEEKLELFGFELDFLEKGKEVEVEIKSEDNSNYYVQSITTFQDAILPKVELDSKVEIGSKINVLVFKFYAEEYYVSERRLLNQTRAKAFAENYQVDDVVNGKVVSFEDPFFKVELKEGSASVHKSKMDVIFVGEENAESYINNRYDFVIKRKRKSRYNTELELDRQALLTKVATEKFEQIQLDDEYIVNEFKANKGGLEFDYNGFRGFVPLSEVSHYFFKNSNEALESIDEATKVVVIEKKEGRNNTVVCSIKKLHKAPWEIIEESYEVGDTITRDVIEKKEYGLLFEIEDNVRGLLHKNEMSNELTAEFKNVCIGDSVTFILKEIDLENQRISLTNIEE